MPPPLLLCYLCVNFYNLIYLFTVTVFVLITGGGITERNLQRILEGSGAQEFHCSARSSRESAMKFRCVYFPVSGERWDLSLWLHALGDFLPHVDLIIFFLYNSLLLLFSWRCAGTPASQWELLSQHLSTAWRWQMWAKSEL